MRWAFPASVALHVALLAWVLAAPARGGLPKEVPPLEVELVQQASAQRGAAPAPPSPPPPSPASPPAQSTGDLAARPPEQPRPEEPTQPAAVNLGDADRDLDPLIVTGEHVVPPAPDALFRNKPPGYPAEAARAGEQGMVRLLVHVSASGVPDAVMVAGSSGSDALDRAARDAVLLWRFRPALADGTPVPFDYRLELRFVLGGRR